MLCREEEQGEFAALLFRETTTIGLRRRVVERFVLPRRFVRVRTPYGEVSVKCAFIGGERVNATPEYEDCKAAAAEAGVPLKAVLAAAAAVVGAAGDGGGGS